MTFILLFFLSTLTKAQELDCKKLRSESLSKPVSSVLEGGCEAQREKFEFEHLLEQAKKDWEKGAKEMMWAIDATPYVYRQKIAKALMESPELKSMIQYSYVSEDNIIVQYHPFEETKLVEEKVSNNLLYLWAFLLFLILSSASALVKARKLRK